MGACHRWVRRIDPPPLNRNWLLLYYFADNVPLHLADVRQQNPVCLGLVITIERGILVSGFGTRAVQQHPVSLESSAIL